MKVDIFRIYIYLPTSGLINSFIDKRQDYQEGSYNSPIQPKPEKKNPPNTWASLQATQINKKKIIVLT